MRTSAGWLLGRLSTDAGECAEITHTALSWVRSVDQELQTAGASILALPNLASSGMHIAELAQHANPSVRCAAVWAAGRRAHLEPETFEQLASDPESRVRIAVAQLLQPVRSMNPLLYKRIRACLLTDPSAVVRAYVLSLEEN